MRGRQDKERPAHPGRGGGPLDSEKADCQWLDNGDDSEPLTLTQEGDDEPKLRSDFAEFAWWGDDVEDVVVQEQPPLAVYTNTAGAVVLRTRDWPNDDTWIIVAPEFVPKVVRAMLDAAGIDPASVLRPSEPKPGSSARSDATAAERQRRYRERKRNAPDRDTTVTRDGERDEA